MVTAVKSKRSSSGLLTAGIRDEISEVVAFCPRCKNLQTLWFSEGQLVQTKKFTQRGDKIYHDCGSGTPCRLYRFS
jgi:phage FluMu protein Com